MKRHKHLFSFLLTTLSVPLVLVIQEWCPESIHTLKNYLIFSLVLAVLFVSGYLEYGEYKTEKEKENERKIEERNKNAKKVLSHIMQLTELKAKYYRDNTYDLVIADKEWPIFYEAHNYLYEVCLELKHTVADIIKQESDYVDVSLIYKYCGEEQWKWLAGKSGLTGSINLNTFVNDSSTLYNYIINNPKEVPAFCNDKTKCEYYKLGRRDKIFDGKGSFYAIPITFSNNKEALVDAILLISTYGVNFIPTDSGKEKEKEFKRNLAYEVLPYFVSVIQAELGALYIKHNIKEVIHLKKNKRLRERNSNST